MDIIRNIPRYLLDELLADVTAGHNVRATVYMECGAMYRADGPEALRCVGETEFVNGIAAMTASGIYGDVRACLGIVWHVNLKQGADVVEDVLRSHIAAGHGRFRGIRHSASYDEDPNVLGPLSGRNVAGLYLDPAFRDGFKVLAKLGLSFDAWLVEPQLPDLIDLARAFPDTTIVLDHVGTPLGIGRYRGKLEERFGVWREQYPRAGEMRERACERPAACPMPFAGFKAAHGGGRSAVGDAGGAMEALYRDLHRGVRRPTAACSRAISRWTRFGCDYVSLWTRSSGSRRNYSPADKTRALQRHGGEGVPAGAFIVVIPGRVTRQRHEGREPRR